MSTIRITIDVTYSQPLDAEQRNELLDRMYSVFAKTDYRWLIQPPADLFDVEIDVQPVSE
jgi:hypothetical protein